MAADTSTLTDYNWSWNSEFIIRTCYGSTCLHYLCCRVQSCECSCSSAAGCGNSSMSSDMHSCGFTSITNIDYSAVCIEAMAARHRGCPGMDWHQMDARSLTFAEGSFDVVLEKGTLDAMMVEEKDPWRVSPETSEMVQQVLKQVSRVLKPGGRFISITFAQPHFRKQQYAREEFGWSVRHDTYGSGFHYFLYVMTKGEALSPEERVLQSRLDEGEGLQPPPTLQIPDTEDFLNNIQV
ncbi:Endothelin-converting enzyme 2 [Acipenser ruthenus]|uniref:Endothelin-converting enzyme 2 n=1 Tax=Acipenser ruthenus TaxID=7906 RepID=A0A662YUH4_ACIRT|nr:Endothelin-converting enzyme 2 [Acipenser ruthenus]